MNDQELQDLTFEAALAELEQTVTKLESGDLPLEQAIELFERGQRLAAFCSKQLETASLKVEMLTNDGEIAELTGI